MKVVLDTNVLISATFWPGNSYKIIKKVERGEIELFLSLEILKEFSEVLSYEEIQKKIKIKNLYVNYSIEKLVSISKIIFPKEKINIIKEDPSDNKFLECAYEGKVDYIISKDKHILRLKEFKNIKIVTPEEFLKLRWIN